MVARYNIQIDDLIATVSQLKKAREIYLIPINQLEKQAQIKNQDDANQPAFASASIIEAAAFNS